MTPSKTDPRSPRDFPDPPDEQPWDGPVPMDPPEPSKTDRFDELEELLRAATPLPWGIDHESPKTILAHDGTGAFVMRLGDARVFSYAVQMHKNVDLALAAVNALPALLAERKRLREAVERLLWQEDNNPGWERENLDFDEIRSLLAGSATPEEEQD